MAGGEARVHASVRALWGWAMGARSDVAVCRWSRPAGQPNGLDHGVALLHMIIVRAVSCLICKLYT